MMGFSSSCCQCKHHLSLSAWWPPPFSVLSPRNNAFLLFCLWYLCLDPAPFLFCISLDNFPDFAVWPFRAWQKRVFSLFPEPNTENQVSSPSSKLNSSSHLILIFSAFPAAPWSEMYYPEWCRWGPAEKWKGIEMSCSLTCILANVSQITIPTQAAEAAGLGTGLQVSLDWSVSPWLWRGDIHLL